MRQQVDEFVRASQDLARVNSLYRSPCQPARLHPGMEHSISNSRFAASSDVLPDVS